MFLWAITIYCIIKLFGFQWPKNFHYCLSMERIPITWYPDSFNCLSLLKLETHCFYICKYLAPPKCWLRRKAERSSDILPSSYHIMQGYFFFSFAKVYSYFKNILEFSIGFLTLKTKGAERWERWGLSAMIGLQVPRWGGSPRLPQQPPIRGRGIGPSVAHGQLAFRTMVKFSESWPEERI